MLPAERDSRPELEVAALAAEAPDDPARAPADLVDRMRVAGGDEQVAVVVDVDRVDVEVVIGAAGISRQAIVGLHERHVVDAVPLEQNAAGPDVELLQRAFEHGSTLDAHTV